MRESLPKGRTTERFLTPEAAHEPPGFIQRIFSLFLLASGAVLLGRYPILKPELAAALVVYALILRRFHSAWLVVIPALLPVLDFAPWSGWFFFDEFDLFVLTTVAVNLWTTPVAGESGAPGRMTAVVLLLLSASYAVSLWIGLSFWPMGDPNSFAHYYSPYNGFRVAKGFFWAAALLPFLCRSVSRDPKTVDRFATGMVFGLAGACLVTLIERYLFTGWFDFSTPFRITGMFSSMHIGGQHIDAYLALTLPFIFAIFTKKHSPGVVVSGFILFALSMYTVSVTFSRGLLLALAAAVVFFAASRIFTATAACRSRIQIVRNSILGVGVAGIICIPVLTADFMRHRLLHLNRDLKLRIQHWRHVSEIRDRGATSILFGMGLGAFPRLYAAQSKDPAGPGSYEYRREAANTYVRLHAGRNIYFGQIVNLKPNRRYRLSLDIRSRSPGARIRIPICEKTVQYSFRCVSVEAAVRSPDGAWEHYETAVDAGRVGDPVGSFMGRAFNRPVTLALYPSVTNTAVDLDNIRLIDETGKNLISNGDFEKGNDRWFFGTDNHRAWRIDNMWVHLFFEQGLFGAGAFAVFVFYFVYRLLIRIKQMDRFALISGASFFGLLIVGMVESVFDAPRIAFLTYLIAGLGLLRLSGPPLVSKAR